jgi:hypothetical protein
VGLKTEGYEIAYNLLILTLLPNFSVCNDKSLVRGAEGNIKFLNLYLIIYSPFPIFSRTILSPKMFSVLREKPGKR